MPKRLSAGILVVAATVMLSACGGSSATSGTTSAAPAQTASAPGPSPAGGQAASPVQKVNANSASAAELQRAFEAAGISNAARWAREVEEYRPYPTTDPSFAKLRQELAKYNPGPAVVDQIVATLAL